MLSNVTEFEEAMVLKYLIEVLLKGKPNFESIVSFLSNFILCLSDL